MLISDALGQRFRLRVTAHALRSVEHRGGLDAFLLKADEKELSMRARLLRRQIAQKTAEAPLGVSRLYHRFREGSKGYRKAISFGPTQPQMVASHKPKKA